MLGRDAVVVEEGRTLLRPMYGKVAPMVRVGRVEVGWECGSCRCPWETATFVPTMKVAVGVQNRHVIARRYPPDDVVRV